MDYYTVEDSVDTKNRGYEYFFNICGQVLSSPSKQSDNCLYSDGTSTFWEYCEKLNNSVTPNKCRKDSNGMALKQQINSLAFAYQYKAATDECWPLSSNKAETAYNISLFDESDPTQGIKIIYKNGGWAEDPCGANRALTVNLKCENNPASVPRSTDVTEYTESGCEYELTVSSMHGCPLGCGSFANSLCASQGLCGYDYATNRSRCFCYWGYSGSMCELNELDIADVLWFPSPVVPDTAQGPNMNTYSIEIPLSDPFDGTVHNHVVNVTYDLSSVHNIKTVYQINDTAEKNSDFQYFFNIGGTVDVSLLPSICQSVIFPCDNLQNASKCQSESYNLQQIDNLGYAFRFKNGSREGTEDECILLGSDVLFSSDPSIALYDQYDNPAHGIKLYYANGSYDAGSNTNCNITLSLICPDTRKEYIEARDGLVIDSSEVEKINDECEFAASFESALACPYNCITRDDADHRHVCNGRGMCVADPKLGFVRCVDELYFGDACERKYSIDDGSGDGSEVESSNVTGFKVVIGLISVFLIGFVIAVAYLYMRNKTLERYAVPILEDHEQIEPRVPEYSDDSDEEKGYRGAGGSGGKQQEMVTMKTSFGDRLKKKMKKQKKTKKRGKNKYQAQEDDYSDDDDEANGPSAYLAAHQGDDSDSDSD